MADRMLRLGEVLAMTGLSRTTLWRRIRADDFPPQRRLGPPGSRAVGWPSSEVEAWMDDRPTAA